MTKTHLFLICSLLCLISTGCEDKKADPLNASGSPEKVAEPRKPGKIEVVSGKPAEGTKYKQDPFRTFDIRGEAIIKYAPDGMEVTQEVKNVQLNVAVRNTPYAQIQARLLSKRLSKEFIVFCSACHDDYANGVIGPSLIDKSEKEILEMIDKYHLDPNANVLMTTLVERMTPEEKAFIAKDIAQFNYEYHNSSKQTHRSDADFKSKYVKE